MPDQGLKPVRGARVARSTPPGRLARRARCGQGRAVGGRGAVLPDFSTSRAPPLFIAAPPLRLVGVGLFSYIIGRRGRVATTSLAKARATARQSSQAAEGPQ